MGKGNIPVPDRWTPVRYNSLLWMCTLNTLTWPDLGKGMMNEFMLTAIRLLYKQRIHLNISALYVRMYWCMTTSMYCLYVGFDYTYIDVNALAQGIKSFLASHVWFQAVAGARTYGTYSPAITSQPP